MMGKLNGYPVVFRLRSVIPRKTILSFRSKNEYKKELL